LPPASHYALPDQEAEVIIEQIGSELDERCKILLKQGDAVSAQRLRSRTEYDMELLSETGFCSGIENYSRYLDHRSPGEMPYCLLDYFPDDYLCIIDESHQTLPQIGAMSRGDAARKQTLIDHGFRLPSALDNRPQTFNEFLRKAPQILCLSATPGEWEKTEDTDPAELIIRPTGICDPIIEVRPREGQVDDLLGEIKIRANKKERVLVTCLTKRMAEKLDEYLGEAGIRARYIHSDIDTLDRIQIIGDLRSGKFDVLVGVNLLREGLDLPEVSLVAILDAGQEGFLRGETALIQTIGRAARHLDGRVIMYSDHNSKAMDAAISETDRRRSLQQKYNKDHSITPSGLHKSLSRSINEVLRA
jgi:excinuclease ABC subunit B